MEDRCLARTDMEEMGDSRVLCAAKEGKRDIVAILARKSCLSVTLNEPELAALLRTATNLHHLAVGFSASEWLLGCKDEIKMITVDGKNGMIWVETINDRRQPPESLPKRVIAYSGGRGLPSGSPWGKMGSQVSMSTDWVFGLVEKFQYRSPTCRATGGTSSAALCDTSDMPISGEDIGSHNAPGRVPRECIPEDIPTENRIVLTSGDLLRHVTQSSHEKAAP